MSGCVDPWMQEKSSGELWIMMLCHPVMEVRHVIETQKKKRNA